HQQLALVHAVGEHPRERAEEQRRDELEGGDDPDRGPGLPREVGEHQPVLPDTLHPGTDVRHQGAGEPQPVVELAQRREHGAHWVVILLKISSAWDRVLRSSTLSAASRRESHWSRRRRVSVTYSRPSSVASTST